MSINSKTKIKKMTWIYYFFILITTSVASASARDTIFSNQTLKDGDFLVSAGGVFEFGFFGLGKSSFRYLGIRYKNIPTDNVVWVANRDAPLVDHKGMLKLNGTLQLLNVSNNLIWSSEQVANTSASNLVAQLLDSGNLVLKDDNVTSGKRVIWQSFDCPDNTWLSGMKLGNEVSTGIERSLTSWKSSDDPSPGPFTLWVQGAENPQLFISDGISSSWNRIGYWNGLGFNGMTSLKPSNFNKFDFVPSWEGSYARYTLVNDSGVLTRMVLKVDSSFQQLVWMNRTQSWDVYMTTSSIYPCGTYDSCGSYGGCNFTKLEAGCQCLQGFEPKLQHDWSASDHSSVCKPENVTTSENGHYFKKYSNMKLPDPEYSKSNLTMSLEECKIACSNNATANCTAYANIDIRGTGSGCRMWFGGLVDIRVALPGDISGQDIVVLLPVSLALLLGVAVGLYAWRSMKKSHLTGEGKLNRYFSLQD